jgi:type II secretory pathway component PulF
LQTKPKKYITVEGHPDLARDPDTGAIVNINTRKVQQQLEQKRLKHQKIKEQKDLKAKVEGLESDISDMKNMLSQLIEKL